MAGWRRVASRQIAEPAEGARTDGAVLVVADHGADVALAEVDVEMVHPEPGHLLLSAGRANRGRAAGSGRRPPCRRRSAPAGGSCARRPWRRDRRSGCRARFSASNRSTASGMASWPIGRASIWAWTSGGRRSPSGCNCRCSQRLGPSRAISAADDGFAPQVRRLSRARSWALSGLGAGSARAGRASIAAAHPAAIDLDMELRIGPPSAPAPGKLTREHGQIMALRYRL